MPGELVDSGIRDAPDPFAQNIVAEAITIVVILGFGIASSVLIVRGLPRTPVYEFYLFVLVFTWVNILIPLGIMGMDITLRKHMPEAVGDSFSSLTRMIGIATVTSICASFGIVLVVNVLLSWLPPNFFVPSYARPFFQLALWTIPLTAVSTVLQGAFRGLQKMRYCTQAMGLYHGVYFACLMVLFVTGTMTLLTVILANFAASGLTIGYETGMLQKLIRQHQAEPVGDRRVISAHTLTSTATQALFLALLGTLFLYLPLLIANLSRTSDVILAGLGLALSVAVWIQQGLSAPFNVLMPRTAGEVAQQGWSAIQGYMKRVWKLGVVLCTFIAVVAVFYAAPVLIVMFAGEGMVAFPFFILLAGSLLIYPLATMMTDTLIGLGKIRSVLIVKLAWTMVAVLLLWFLTPIGREVIVALIWVAGIPFLFIYFKVYQQTTQAHLVVNFLPKAVVVLAVIGVLSFSVLGIGSYLIITLGLVGFVGWVFQIGLVLTIIPLAVVYLWLLGRSGVFDSGDWMALLRISQVLHPVSRPVSWLVERISLREEESDDLGD